ncbi:MAG: Coenzyme F420 hydrogenase/dehydrogenase, beta subunit C-terminal domain [Candidatus Thorarchaeota archaeon]|nr:MAG: Coenzyme F420 hydrogenase/dehydrogenase, beta subunit C-terminal domain [Candidatus Thorarchaeota archaeon]
MTSEYEETVSRMRRWLKENTKRNAFKKLENDIIQKGVCTECGACVAGCPVEALEGDMSAGKFVPTLVGKCVACGICYTFCPRTLVTWSSLVGDFRSAWKARSLDETQSRQNGGIATALVTYMLDKKIVDAAVVAARDGETPWMPVAKLVKKPKEAAACGGTIYTHTPVVQEMVRGFKDGLTSMAVVGMSCNIDSISKMQNHPAGMFQVGLRADVIKVGLFCMESFDYNKLVGFLKGEKIKIGDVNRFEISGGKFRIRIGDEEKEWPIADLDPYVSSSCHYCRDLTCMNADISCGNLGTDDDWTTVLVRTPRGEQIFQEALADGLIEAELLEGKAMRVVENVARSKATRIYTMKPEH